MNEAKLYHSSDWLYQRYWEDLCTIPQMAREAGCGTTTIWRWLKRHGIARRGPSQSLEDRFWSKVSVGDKNECWEWLAATGSHNMGYGVIGIGQQVYLAHRVAWELVYDKIPEGMCVCHGCDNPSCVNPDHLFLGTYADNNADMATKGRSAHGARHHNAKLTKSDVLEIRRLRAKTSLSQRAIGEMFGVTRGAVKSILCRQSWAWL